MLAELERRIAIHETDIGAQQTAGMIGFECQLRDIDTCYWARFVAQIPVENCVLLAHRLGMSDTKFDQMALLKHHAGAEEFDRKAKIWANAQVQHGLDTKKGYINPHWAEYRRLVTPPDPDKPQREKGLSAAEASRLRAELGKVTDSLRSKTEAYQATKNTNKLFAADNEQLRDELAITRKALADSQAEVERLKGDWTIPVNDRRLGVHVTQTNPALC
jgi:hypothetical protein